MRRMLVLFVIIATIFFASVLIAQLLNASDTPICRDDGTINPFDQLSAGSMAADPISAVAMGPR
jgi:membrane protein CcdC involved in cytochrome C biogenesis